MALDLNLCGFQAFWLQVARERRSLGTHESFSKFVLQYALKENPSHSYVRKLNTRQPLKQIQSRVRPLRLQRELEWNMFARSLAFFRHETPLLDQQCALSRRTRIRAERERSLLEQDRSTNLGWTAGRSRKDHLIQLTAISVATTARSYFFHDTIVQNWRPAPLGHYLHGILDIAVDLPFQVLVVI